MTLTQLLTGFVRRHWPAYTASGLMLIGIALLTVWVPRQVGQVVDALAAERLQGAALLHELALLALAGLCIYLLRVGWRMALFAAAYRLGRELRTRLYAVLTQQGPRFFQAQKTGNLMALATNDIDAVEMAVGEALLAAFDGTLTLALVLAMMTLGVDWRLGLAALLPFPFMGLAFWFISKHVHTASQDSLARFSALNQHTQETLSGLRTLRALGLQGQSAERFHALADSAGEAAFRAQRWEAAFEPAVGMALTTAMSISLGLGAWLLARGELSLGQLTAFTMYLGQLIWPMFAAGWVLSLLERGRAAWARLQPILDAPSSLQDRGQQAIAPAAELRLQGVSLSYPGAATAALQDISVALKSGQTLGIVGPTGAGKSTLVKLLLRQYEPDQGSITLGGVALADVRLDALRAAMAWVPQEPFLFSATLAENIALACPEASRSELENAARLAAVHADISALAAGYDTEVGERGVTLSGGQRQRVAIARALVRPAPWLVLDDALSAVDTGTESAILEHLRELRQARPEQSLMVVSHRLSAVLEADHIIVLKAGRMLEQGTHAQLLAAQGWYAQQWRYQQLEAQLEKL